MIRLATLTACPSRTPTPAPPAVGLADDSVVQALWRERTSGGVRTEPCLGPGDLLEISVFRWPDLQGYRTRVTPAGTHKRPLFWSRRGAGLPELQPRAHDPKGRTPKVMP